MPNINDKNVKPETTTEKVNEEPKVDNTPDVKAIPKKVRKPREKVRPVEECYDLPLSKLTPKEKDNLIKELKEALNLATNQVDAYKQNAESAFNQTRQMEEQYKAMEKYFKDQLRYIDMQIKAFHTAVNQAIKGGVE